MKFIHIMLGGPTRKIQVDGKVFTFEMHRYCGPMLLKRNGEPAAHQPNKFIAAASLWAQQGERMEGDLCRWDREPKKIVQHLGGRHWKLVGYEPAVRGE